MPIVVFVRLPLVPVNVSAYVPGWMDAVVVNVRVEEPEPVTVSGLKVADEPDGSPSTLKSTTPAKPFAAATVTANVVPPLTPIVCEAGAAEIEKLGAEPTTKVGYGWVVGQPDVHAKYDRDPSLALTVSG